MSRRNEWLDVHLEVRPKTPSEWLERSLHGVKTAIERVQFPIKVYLVKGMPGPIGSLCGGGYTVGRGLYACHTAVEEYVTPHSFEEVERVLFDPAKPCSLSEYAVRNGKLVRNLKHDLLIVRSDLLLDRAHPYGMPTYRNHVARQLPDSLFP